MSGSPSPPKDVVGELGIETMRQALRKTGSGDLSGVMGRDWESSMTGSGSVAGASTLGHAAEERGRAAEALGLRSD